MTTETEKDLATGEMVDRIRNRGTMTDKVMIDRETLDSMIEQRIKMTLIETYESLIDILLQKQHDNPISGLDPDCLNKAIVALSNDTTIEMFSEEIKKLKG